MRVLFIYKFEYVEPLGIMYLSSMLKSKGYETYFLDIKFEKKIMSEIKKISPDVIAYSVRTGFHQHYTDLNNDLKKKFDFISVFGGPHATFFPHMINEAGVDCVCRGEADEAFLEFLDALESGKNITKIKNFWIKKNGKIYKNDCRPLIQDLDKLKFADRALLDNYEEIRNSKVRSFMTGRGCPFNCSYCFNAGFKKLYPGQKYLRRRSVDSVIQEIKEVKDKYKIEFVFFEDDTFNVDKEWLREFSAKFSALNLKFGCAGIRADFLDEEAAMLLKKANCTNVTFGLESGSEPIRKNILGRNMSNLQIINCAKNLRKYNIRYVTENILAIPTASLEDDLKTLELNMKCKPFYCITHIMQPYPCTEICDIAIKNNMFKENAFDNLGSFYGKSPLKISNRLERENLQRIMALIVRYPFLYPHARWLISLKIKGFYSFLHNSYKAWIGINWFPYTRTPKEYINLFRRYFFSERKKS